MEENDKIISEFIGGRHSTKTTPFGKIEGFWFSWIDSPKKWKTMLQENHFITEFHYHDSWDWIMPVVKKIMELETPEKESTGWYAYYSIEANLPLVDISLVHDNVIEYISWYNEQSK